MSCKEWNKVKIEEVCSIKRGASPRPIINYISETGIPWVKISDATSHDSRFIKKTGEFIIEEGKNKSRFIKSGTLILSNSATPGIPKIMGIDACVHDGWLIIDNFKNISKEFMYYLFINERERLLSLSNGSVFRNLKTDIVKNYEVMLPEKEEQNRIVNVLLSLDNKIELNNKMNKTLEEMAQALFKRWFVDFEFSNEEGKPYKSSGGEMVESELGMIPKKSEIKELGELCKLITKSVKPYENESVLYEHFSLPACDEGKVAKMEFGNNISSNKYKIDNDCILMSKLNPTTKRIWNPLCESENSICSTEFMVYKPNEKNKKDFYYEVINSKDFSEYLVSKATGSTGSRQRVKPKETLQFKLVVLEEEIIYKFNKLVKDIHDKVQQNIIQNVSLKELRDSLLPKLMSGEIRVDNVETDI